jgi:hypothetical protein
MDHNEATRSQACEKYLLGELPADLRDAFEEHYFSCAECAVQLQTVTEFLAASRDILSEVPVSQPRPDYVRVTRGWFAWLNPLVAVPVFAALLLAIAYQNFVTIPHWKHEAASSRVLSMYSLISANSRGGEGLVFSAAPNEPLGLYVDVPFSADYSSYSLRLIDPAGSSSFLRSLSSAEAQKTQVVIVNPGRYAGPYAVVVSGIPISAAGPASEQELARLRFTVVLSK